jgi:2-polyprenyl-3-methyl-5-hydroxy-6-metoxy-1,4-benzoquinol methylase
MTTKKGHRPMFRNKTLDAIQQLQDETRSAHQRLAARLDKLDAIQQLQDKLDAIQQLQDETRSAHQRLAARLDKLDADNRAIDQRVDEIFRRFDRVESNLAIATEDRMRELGRLDADLLKGFERTEAALRLLPAASPEQSAANAIAALVSAARQTQTAPIEVELPHPFANMTRQQWSKNIKLWLQYAPTLLNGCKARSCPACGSGKSAFIFVSHDGYPYNECDDCRAWFVPLRVNAELFERYFAACPEAREGGNYMVTQEADNLQESDTSRFDAYFSEILTLRNGIGGNLLDIGCGVGTSLDSASKFGFVSTGVEINSAAREIAWRRGRKVFATFSELGTEKFDVISLFESLEHMDNPDEIGEFAARALAPEGLLVITVPNLNSPAIRGMRSDSLHINGGSGFAGHMNLFSATALQRFLGRHGFKAVMTRGQFSVNLFEVVGYHLGLWRGARDYLDNAKSSVVLPAKLHDFLNVIGPAVADWERENAMGPILHVIARRNS